MAMTNYERVGRAMELLRLGLAPFVERELGNVVPAPQELARSYFPDDPMAQKPLAEWDASLLLRLMWDAWNSTFKQVLGFSERSLVSELRTFRNRWAHQEKFSSDDTDRALDSAARLLTAISAPEADELNKMKMELRRIVYDEQVRGEKRRAGGSLVEAAPGVLKPWRAVVEPHDDVASGRYQQAEFAADLWQVHRGEGASEYRDPREFFRRTFLTDSLRRLLAGGAERLSGKGGDPVVQLQTNFGGGKTHSMLALYHLFSGVQPGELAGAEDILAEAGIDTLPAVRRVVLVGNKISPGNPSVKPDGFTVRTLWGELAWQLGGAAAYERIRADDERATNPGDLLRELLREYGPCLILVDEWVAYARQLHDSGDLPGGSFETQFSFAQTLTESAKGVENSLLVVSLPASDTGAPRREVDDTEVGGLRGREALDRLQNVVGRVESSWRPATAEEGFEIVRRRLFKSLDGADAFKSRDVTARAFSELYRSQRAEFPPECHDADYEERVRSAYPIHPEIFDRLYTDWSALVRFQRTRGVLRLMASVIHSLWERGDTSPLILPSTIPIDDPRVRSELTRYLPDNWDPVIGKDVDGPQSLPLRIDGDNPNLGKFSAARRVARTLYLGSAPTTTAPQKGVEDRRVKLGCAVPGDPVSVFGDALRRLVGAATYLYQDGVRYWYSTQPTVTKLAEDRAELLRREPERVAEELEKRLKNDLRQSADFERVHLFPRSSADVPDDQAVRLVVLSPEHPFTKKEDNAAEAAAREILENRGTAPRLYRNTLIFLAADKIRLQDMEAELRKYLAWRSILEEKESLNLDPHQARQSESQLKAADAAVLARLPETYQTLLVPTQSTPQEPVTFQAVRLSSGEGLAVRACKKLRNDENLLLSIGPAILRRYIDAIPLWRGDGNAVSLRQLAEDFAQYPYLPRIANPRVLVRSASEGVALLTWRNDTFAYAEGYDGARYLGLRGGQNVSCSAEGGGLLVRPEAAEAQLKAEQEAAAKPAAASGTPADGGFPAEPASASQGSGGERGMPALEVRPRPRRFHGTVRLDPGRVALDAGRVAEAVIAHLEGQVGSRVSVMLEIEAELPDGAPEHIIRAVTENSATLKFEQHAFESE